MDSVEPEVNERKVKGVGLATLGSIGIVVGVVFGVFAPPLVGIALGATIVAMGLKSVGLDFLKEVRLKFWS